MLGKAAQLTYNKESASFNGVKRKEKIALTIWYTDSSMTRAINKKREQTSLGTSTAMPKTILRDQCPPSIKSSVVGRFATTHVHK